MRGWESPFPAILGFDFVTEFYEFIEKHAELISWDESQSIKKTCLNSYLDFFGNFCNFFLIFCNFL